MHNIYIKPGESRQQLHDCLTAPQPPVNRQRDRETDRKRVAGETSPGKLRERKMRAVVLVPLLLCAVMSVDQVRAEVKAVKLCGREFLRAVVYTCGGSRWRRFLTESDMDAPAAVEPSALESLSSSSSSSSPGSGMTRRDINNILTTMCCQMGCRKSDLTFLC